MPSLARRYGGPVTALVGFVSASEVVGIQSTVVGPRCDPADASWLAAQMPRTTVITGTVGGTGPWSGAVGVLPKVRRLLADADIVHVHGLLNPTSSGASRLAISARRAVVIGPFGTMSPYTFSHRRAFAKRLYFRLIDAANLRHASALHFTTALECAEAAWHGIDATGRAYVVPPPYAVTSTARAGTAATRGSSDPVVLFLGRLDPKKGVEVLIESWRHIVGRYPEATLRIAGAGPAGYTAHLRRLAGAMGTPRSIRFLGFVGNADKERQLREASVLVLASQHENFGIAVLDAVAAGVPVVVTPGVQLAPWVVEQDVGRSTDATADAVGRTIVEILEDDAFRGRVAAIGRETVARSFAPTAVAPALQAMYRGALVHRQVSP
jgi:glycosyltransferase involved in cell wall biosynthesis